jgi:hypothetical protein
LLDLPFYSSLPNGFFWWGSWDHWHSVLILIGMWWFLSCSCFCCLRVWLCTAELMLLSAFLSLLLLWFGTACLFMVLFAFISCVHNSFENLL